MPNWAGSDWYFLRYADAHNDQALADPKKLSYWMPVDLYIGGDEHNTLHLLYSRFIYQFLHDLGVVPAGIPEPYQKRMSHGVILGPDGQRMSKSRGNVVVPDDYVKKVGADAVRAYLMFIGPFDATMAWNERALMGVKRFLDRFEALFKDNLHARPAGSAQARGLVNRLARQVGEDIEVFKFNTALAKMMETLNSLSEAGGQVSDRELEALVKLIAPFAPFLSEECWQALGKKGSVHSSDWPVYDPSLELAEAITVAVQINGKLRGTLEIQHGEAQAEISKRAAELESVARHLADKQVVKEIYVPERTINFVVR
jgi:leucyl-tRNA synthetase